MPASLVRALSNIEALSATAELASNDGSGSRAAPVALVLGADGRSFSGFLPASPGAYALEVVFRGRPAGDATPIFLGRWVSDAFTVVDGDVVTPTFSQPLDVVGREDDHGDDDRDGLGNLDELIFETDRTLADSDGDEVIDGSDCAPRDATERTTAARAGHLADCDGDGRLRPESPFLGDDCNDRDPDVHPGKRDDCSDAIDQDCNPATCRLGGPSITLLEPTPNATVGCHTRIRARISDPTGVNNPEVLFVDDGTPPTVEQQLVLLPAGGDEFATRELGVATVLWLENGPQRFFVRASDLGGTTRTATSTVIFQLDVPSASITPATIGTPSAPVELAVTAAAPAGIASIRLMIAPVQAESVDRARETVLAQGTTSPLSFTIDPAAFTDGSYALYPIVTDRIGNRLEPQDSFQPSLQPDGTFVADAEYLCLFDAGVAAVPVRSLVIGAGSTEPPAKMRDHLSQAISEAAARDPAAVLVEVRGFGVGPDGVVRLDDALGGSGKWWRYVFFNFAADRLIEVTWYAASYGITNPEIVVTENSPFGFSYSPVLDPAALVDSDVAAAAYSGAVGCLPLTGIESDSLRYENDQPFRNEDVIRIDVEGPGGSSTGWKATATAPVTERSACP